MNWKRKLGLVKTFLFLAWKTFFLPLLEKLLSSIEFNYSRVFIYSFRIVIIHFSLVSVFCYTEWVNSKITTYYTTYRFGCLFGLLCAKEQIIWLLKSPVAEFSEYICSTPKFICSSDDGVPWLLNIENDTSYIKVPLTKTGWCEYYISLKSNL